jgi:hypothetical protein
MDVRRYRIGLAGNTYTSAHNRRALLLPLSERLREVPGTAFRTFA